MAKFGLSDRYSLELHWDRADYERDGICSLTGAYLFGPALSEALELQENDHIMLDFFKQYLVLVENVYVAKFSWRQVNYDNKNSRISLKNSFIAHDTELNKVPKLKDSDYLIIDTSNHEVAQHPFNPVYRTYVVNETTNLYNFRS